MRLWQSSSISGFLWSLTCQQYLKSLIEDRSSLIYLLSFFQDNKKIIWISRLVFLRQRAFANPNFCPHRPVFSITLWIFFSGHLWQTTLLSWRQLSLSFSRVDPTVPFWPVSGPSSLHTMNAGLLRILASLLLSFPYLWFCWASILMTVSHNSRPQQSLWIWFT